MDLDTRKNLKHNPLCVYGVNDSPCLLCVCFVCTLAVVLCMYSMSVCVCVLAEAERVGQKCDRSAANRSG